MSRRWWARESDRPTADIRDAVNEMLDRNGRTKGAQVGELYLGDDILVATLRRPVVIDGACVEVTGRTVDIFDLMDMHERNQ